MAKVKNTFTGGLLRDIHPVQSDNKHYIYAENFRVTTVDGFSTTGLENERGNRPLIILPANHTFVESTTIRNDIIIVSYNGANGYIFRIIESSLNTAISAGTSITLNTDYYHLDTSTHNLVFYGPMTFANTKLFTRYESDSIQKLYIADSSTPLRYINLIHHAQYNDLTDTTRNLRTIAPVEFEIPTVTIQSGGRLYSGKIQYAAQLYETYGAESLFSPLSDPLYLSSSPIYPEFAHQLKGDQIGVEVNKSVKVEITLDTPTDLEKFSRLRVVAIEYKDPDLVPTIRICHDAFINTSSTSITIVDTGNDLGPLSMEEFSGLSNFMFASKTIEAKDNIIYTGNIEESQFDIGDFDTRAYRFDDSGSPVAVVYEEDGSYYTIQTDGDWTHSVSGSGTDWSIPETADCINRFNLFENEHNGSYQYLYTTSGASLLGAEGKNLKLYITQENVTIDSESTDENDVKVLGIDPSNGVKGYYLANEIYRFGIVFRDIYGRRSYPKWVCDLRIHFRERTAGDAICNTGQMSMSYIRVHIKNLPTNAVSWELVRCQRVLSDKTILGFGVLTGVASVTLSDTYWAVPDRPSIEDLTSYDNFHGTVTPPIFSTNIFKAIIPDLFFNKEEITDTCKVKVLGFAKDAQLTRGEFSSFTPPYPDHGANKSIAFKIKYSDLEILDDTPRYQTFSIVDLVHVYEQPGDIISPYTLSGEADPIINSVYTYYVDDDNDENTGQGGEGFFLKLDNDPDYSGASNYIEGDIYYVEIYRDSHTSIYGGNTYAARNIVEYIGCGTESTTTGSLVSVYGGDTYPGMFNYVISHSVAYGESAVDGDKIFSSLTFPVECSYPLALRSDQNPINDSQDYAHALVRSRAGSYLAHDGVTRYNQLYDLYSYNRSYSRDLDGQKFLAMEDFDEETTFDCRVYASNLKTNGELTDSWLKYRVDQFLDVDTRYGPLTAIINYNNTLFFFQEKAFGYLSVNERALTQTSDNQQLILGEGGILDRYIYISTETGARFHDEVKATKHGIFWIDQYNSTICMFAGREGVISQSRLGDLKVSLGLDSYISEIIKLSNTSGNIELNEITDDIYFSIINSAFTNVLVFNTVLNAFTGVLTFSTSEFLKYNKYLLSLDDSTLYIHSDEYCEKGVFFGTTYDSKVSFIVNPAVDQSVYFSNVSWLSYCTAPDGTEVNATFSILRVTDSYQDTGVVTPVLHKRFREWSGNIPRALYNEVGTVLERTDGKMKDYYIIIDLTFENSSDNKFKVESVITDVIISNNKFYQKQSE